ncbi:copper homeostasis membrane protein CopD [Pseudomonas sp. R5(2019)]|uniref:copper homeostasis membrane protein CopD n=1 Tax=Pseudomonas sp. R5(2019) TaxID=2697566 RepID=UPI001412EDA8|nr:copper homeostasis membrane protein CopD [Pseudomonas sp. R5(2019)]NBA95944.1 copper homeostasis membrane protein CopD [Pseudomonas sp. R5(2019)]
MHSAIVFCRFVHFSIVLLIFGACLLRPLLITAGYGAGQSDKLQRTLERILRWLAFLALVSGVAWLLLTTASMVGSWPAALEPEMLWRVLDGTFFGQVWRWHLALNVTLLGCLLLLRSNPFKLREILSAAVLATLAPVGHGAMLDGLAGQLLMFNQLLHLLCVGAWLGGLLLLALMLAPPQAPNVRQVLHRFSGIGYGLVAGIVLTGLINVRVLTGHFWPTPVFSGFALILLIKVTLVLAMLILALLNRLSSQSGRLQILQTSVNLEWMIGLGAVAAVSWLGTMPPMPA